MECPEWSAIARAELVEIASRGLPRVTKTSGRSPSDGARALILNVGRLVDVA
jgi:hypothetical protein